MAQGARERFGVDMAISVTGIAGPDSDRSKKPVGLTYVGVAGPGLVRVKEFHFKGDRGQNRRQSVEAAIQLALDSIPELRKD
jgi:PncC family amidohydrolase